MSTKNTTSSELTRKRQTRMQFANFIQQQIAVSQGCLRTITIEGGSAGSKMASIFTDIKEGAVYTTAAEQAAILANGACPTTAAAAPAPAPAAPSGLGQWALSTYSATTGGPTTYYASSVDANGNVYVGGQYSTGGSVTLKINNYTSISDQVVSQTTFGTLPARSGATAFLLKYNSSGTAQWGTYVTSATSSSLQDVIADANGNTYALININGSASETTLYSFTSAAGDGSALTLTAYGTTTPSLGDLLLVKYNTSGVIQWAAQIKSSGAGASNETAAGTSRNIALDSDGNIAFSMLSTTGATGTVTFNSADSGFTGGGGTITYTTYGEITGYANAIYMCKVNSSGVFQGVARIKISGTGIVSTAVDSSKNIYVGATFAKPSGANVQVDSSNGVDSSSPPVLQFTSWGSYTPLGVYDVLVLKLNSSLVAQKAALIAGSDTGNILVYTPSIVIDSADNVYVSARYYKGSSSTNKINIYSSNQVSGGTITFTAWGSVPSSATTSGSEVVFTKFSTDLTCSRATYLSSSIDGASPATYNVYNNTMITDSNGNIYIGGYFTGTTFYIYNFSSGGGGLDSNITTTTFGTLSNVFTGASDAFIIKFNSSLVAQWAVKYSGAAANISANDLVHSLSIDPTNSYIYAIGTFTANPSNGLNLYNYGGSSDGGALTQNLFATVPSITTSATYLTQGFFTKYSL